MRRKSIHSWCHQWSWAVQLNQAGFWCRSALRKPSEVSASIPIKTIIFFSPLCFAGRWALVAFLIWDHRFGGVQGRVWSQSPCWSPLDPVGPAAGNLRPWPIHITSLNMWGGARFISAPVLWKPGLVALVHHFLWAILAGKNTNCHQIGTDPCDGVTLQFGVRGDSVLPRNASIYQVSIFSKNRGHLISRPLGKLIF